MDPIFCHICDRSLQRSKSPLDPQKHTKYACYYDMDFDSETEHLMIKTLPKQNGIVSEYFATIHHNNRTFYLQSYRDSNKTTLYRVIHTEYPGLLQDSAMGEVPRFYDLKLKEPLAPQFERIFDNVKLLLTFS